MLPFPFLQLLLAQDIGVDSIGSLVVAIEAMLLLPVGQNNLTGVYDLATLLVVSIGYSLTLPLIDIRQKASVSLIDIGQRLTDCATILGASLHGQMRVESGVYWCGSAALSLIVFNNAVVADGGVVLDPIVVIVAHIDVVENTAIAVIR